VVCISNKFNQLLLTSIYKEMVLFFETEGNLLTIQETEEGRAESAILSACWILMTLSKMQWIYTLLRSQIMILVIYYVLVIYYYCTMLTMMVMFLFLGTPYERLFLLLAMSKLRSVVV
jgi:hypothetical protein